MISRRASNWQSAHLISCLFVWLIDFYLLTLYPAKYPLPFIPSPCALSVWALTGYSLTLTCLVCEIRCFFSHWSSTRQTIYKDMSQIQATALGLDAFSICLGPMWNQAMLKLCRLREPQVLSLYVLWLVIQSLRAPSACVIWPCVFPWRSYSLQSLQSPCISQGSLEPQNLW